jgi:hypothetical protein
MSRVSAHGAARCRPVTTYTMDELVSASGVPERTIRQYVGEGFLPRAEYRGKDTVYGDFHLLGLRAILKLREQGVWRVSALRVRMAALPPDALREFVEGAPPAPAPAPSPPPEPEPAMSPVPAPTEPPAFAPLGERWTHVPLLPGMVLLVRDDAPELVTRLAAEIRERYALGG